VKQHKIAVLANGWLISHAGVMPPYWSGDLDSFLNGCENAWENFREKNHLIFSVGESRGGREKLGGPIWCDWHDDFRDELPYPQIVGHTYCPNGASKGKSFCIDGGQSVYGILEKDGNFKIKTV
jgi:hypothetical protein